MISSEKFEYIKRILFFQDYSTTTHKKSENVIKTRYYKNKKNVEANETNVLIKCIRSYEKISLFVAKLNALISSSLFLDFIIFSILLCALLYQMSRVS